MQAAPLLERGQRAGSQVPFHCHTADGTYLPALAAALERAFAQFTPDLVLYNAGTDILEGDPLGS